MTKSAKPQFHGVDAEEYWKGLLTGEGKGLATVNRLFRKVPRAPRCKLCHAPFAGPVAPIFKMIGFGRWALNQQLCNFCVKGIEKVKGGTEVELSLVYADVRNSTGLAETMSPGEFTTALDEFFELAFEAVDSEDGVIDHIVGDGVMALWVPGFVGAEHPQRALAAARRLARGLVDSPTLGGRIPVGIGVHTGVAFAGVVGQKGSHDFTVLGDVPNTVARLGSAAAGGEIAMSGELVRATGLDRSGLDHRRLELKGKSALFDAWVEQIDVGS